MTASRAPLTRDSLRVKIVVQRVRLAGTEYRVIRPARPLKNGALYKSGHYHMYVDRTDGRRIGTLWLLAARSPRSLVYLPMRTTPVAPGVGWEDEQSLDLVLAPPHGAAASFPLEANPGASQRGECRPRATHRECAGARPSRP